MQWWCSATGQPWSWAWQWYPGVDLFLILIALGWWRLSRRWANRPWRWFAIAWFGLFLALDWPLGKLGAGYLASAHTAQFLLLTLLVGPALLKSIPAEGWVSLAAPGTFLGRAVRWCARALPGLLLYDALVIATHFPVVVDAAMTTQLGSFGIDIAWMAAGLFLWMPIVAPRPYRSLGTFGMIAYIFGATVVPTIPAMMMVFSDWPLYQLYELAPRVSVRLNANDDIKLAGLTMKLIGDLPLWIAAAVVFFRGTTAERDLTNA